MKKKVYLKKITVIGFIFVLVCTLITGCSGKKDKNGSMKSEDGRSYGGLIKAEEGEKVSTAFFDVTVESAAKYDTYQFEDGLYQADAGNTYLVVTLTIQNTYEKDLPMSITDFTLDYDGNKAEGILTGYGKTDIKKDDFMENIFTLKKGESVTKSVLFTVEDKAEYVLEYSEYYEDEFEGDAYEIQIKPEQKSATTETVTTEATVSETTTETVTAEATVSETTTETVTTETVTEAPVTENTEAPVTEASQE